MKYIFLALILAGTACGDDAESTNNGNNSSTNNSNSANNTNSSNNGQTNSNNTNNAAEYDTADLNAVLSAHVDAQGQVDYAALKESDELEALDAFVAAVGATDVSGWDGDQQLAFYINAYNALVLRDVAERFPLDSVMDVEGYFDNFKFAVAGEQMSLNELENDLIRPEFSEPRIHFALVCAAKSCPRLRQEAYEAETLEATLQAAAQEFIPAATTIDGTTVTTSRLFDWFSADFVAESGSVGAYLAEFLPDDAAVLNADPTIEFTEYDWALNVQ